MGSQCMSCCSNNERRHRTRCCGFCTTRTGGMTLCSIYATSTNKGKCPACMHAARFSGSDRFSLLSQARSTSEVGLWANGKVPKWWQDTRTVQPEQQKLVVADISAGIAAGVGPTSRK